MITFVRCVLKVMVLFCSFSCNSQPNRTNNIAAAKTPSKLKNITSFDTLTKTIHVFVALCDNKYQGIVPVPKSIGNGQDANTNLYWGCSNGIRAYFKKSKEWKLLKAIKMNDVKLERLVFKHISKKYYLVADAYDGQYIKKCTIDFLNSTAGLVKDTLHINNKIIGIAGNSRLTTYIGHNGLMDFQLPNNFVNEDKKNRDCIILACISKKYFTPYLQTAKANPVLLTTGLMCPEAYTLHDTLTGYVKGEDKNEMRERAALAYTRYQKCSLKASKNLLVN
jgi:hypothetical protein